MLVKKTKLFSEHKVGNSLVSLFPTARDRALGLSPFSQKGFNVLSNQYQS